MRLIVIEPAPPQAEEEVRLRKVRDIIFDKKAEEAAVSIRLPEELTRLLSGQETLTDARILVLAAVGVTGINLCLMEMLRMIRLAGDCMRGSVGAMIVDGAGEYGTKAAAREIAWTMNEAGCLLIGRPLTEATGELKNHKVLAGLWGVSLEEAYIRSAGDLLARLLAFEAPSFERPKILCLHASNRKTSNTLRLWTMVRRSLRGDADIREIPLRNGGIRDCIGCHYDTCMYFAKTSGCYFGGPVVEEVYPALEECDALVMLCPNYNDAMGANLTSTVNRLTALFRRSSFDRKYVFAVIVSGYSGGDLIARQLIGALNMNKSFILPPHFALQETANEAGSLEKIGGIGEKAGEFAARMDRILHVK